MKLNELLKGVPIIRATGNTNVNISGVAHASDKVEPGFLFAALQGEKRDGHEFLAEAIARGALAVLSERPSQKKLKAAWVQVPDAREALALCSANFYAYPSQEMRIIGITGTKGKTTVAYLLEEILRNAGYTSGVIGTINYRGPNLTVEARMTTPEAPDIQCLLRKFIEAGVTHSVIEVSSHALEQKRVLGVRFDVAVFTNLSGEHLDYHHTMEEYFEAKKKLFFLNMKKRIAVVNQDDPWGKKLLAELPMATVSFGFEPEAIVRCRQYRLGDSGIEAEVDYPGGTAIITSSLLGVHNISNILASVAAALALNIPLSAIQGGIASLLGVPGRLEKIDNNLGFQVFVDYAHTDNALLNLLETIKGLKPGRILLVFGAGGDRDKSKRERMGEVAGTLADRVFLTSDNPRSEDPLAIISEIEKGLKKAGAANYDIIPDRREAIEQALLHGKKGDYILVAGKGHEKYQVIKNKVIPFDDVEVIRTALKKMEAR